MCVCCFSRSHLLSSCLYWQNPVMFLFFFPSSAYPNWRRMRDLPADYFLNSLADQNVLFDSFPPPHSCGLGKWWNTRVTMVTCFFLYISLLEDKRPHGENNPGWIHHNLQPDPNRDNALPEAPQTCRPGEAGGLFIHGRAQTHLQNHLHTGPLTYISCYIICIVITNTS